MIKTPSINYRRCESCGTCSIIAPKMFGIKKGITIIKKYDESMKKEYIKAKKACPLSAIE